MSVFIPTTTVAVQRGEGVDDFGDPVDLPVTLASGVPAAVVENGQRKFRPVDQRGSLIEDYTIRLRPRPTPLGDVAVEEGDRLVDERTNAVYLVTDVSYPQPVVGMADVRVTAQRVGALSQPVNG